MSGIERFISSLKGIKKKGNYRLFYRGHSDADGYKLEPSLFRNSKAYRKESHIFRTLLASQPQEFRDDSSTLEKLVRMQHYSLPTRLLDITSNPLSALYFATSSIHKDDVDGEVVVFKVRENKIKFFDSDTVSCLSNIAFLNPSERNKLRRFIRSVDDIEEFNNNSVVKRLVQFIRAEKPYFLAEIDPNHLREPVFVIPKLSNKRILAQNGAFIVFGLSDEISDENDFDIEIERIRIRAGGKDQIRKDLDLVGYNKGSMFPEIESSAQYITSRLDIDFEDTPTRKAGLRRIPLSSD